MSGLHIDIKRPMHGEDPEVIVIAWMFLHDVANLHELVAFGLRVLIRINTHIEAGLNATYRSFGPHKHGPIRVGRARSGSRLSSLRAR